ncbi:hypothetical protein [Streptomyces sp. WELS2]|uniref:hypothetical protein n=1 Tax=Streptomyces sp. WELS2 TaxID=2749435 RepID=UPI0015EFFBAB|nr:hypothetical protein [Streptomyces sp. WELS2]
MVTESPDITTYDAGLLGRAEALRSDAQLMDEYARRLRATADTLAGCPAAPEWSLPTLEKQAAACATAARQLRAAAQALRTHAAARD